MKKLFLLLVIMTSCFGKPENIVLPNDDFSVVYSDYHLDFRNKRLIVNHYNPMSMSQYPNEDTIHINFNSQDIEYLNKIYVDNEIYNINGELESDNHFTHANSATIKFSDDHWIFIVEGNNGSRKNRRVIKYLHEIDLLLQKKLEKNTLYQKNRKKIEYCIKLL